MFQGTWRGGTIDLLLLLATGFQGIGKNRIKLSMGGKVKVMLIQSIAIIFAMQQNSNLFGTFNYVSKSQNKNLEDALKIRHYKK